MTSWVIENVTLPSGEGTTLFIEGGVFVTERPEGARVVDGRGLIALPGLVDMHVHLREPAQQPAETIATGTRAAAAGGFTAVGAMPNTQPVTHGVAEAEWMANRARETASCEVAVIGAITRDETGVELADIDGMIDSLAHVRVISDDGQCVMNASLMAQAFEAMNRVDGIVAQHAQDKTLAPATASAADSVAKEFGIPGWPRSAESVIVARDVLLAEQTGGHLHVCHVSTKESLEIIREAKKRGINVTAEATPHHLLLGAGLLEGKDTTFKVNPPLRLDDDIEALRQAVLDGTIDVIATDHAPHTPSDKAKEFCCAKPGMVGLEQSLAVIMEIFVNPGLLGWEDVARLMSTTPARLLQLDGQGGDFAPGHPANLVLVDPRRRHIVNRDTSLSMGRNNPYHGLDLPDPVSLTMWKGTVTWRHP